MGASPGQESTYFREAQGSGARQSRNGPARPVRFCSFQSRLGQAVWCLLCADGDWAALWLCGLGWKGGRKGFLGCLSFLATLTIVMMIMTQWERPEIGRDWEMGLQGWWRQLRCPWCPGRGKASPALDRAERALPRARQPETGRGSPRPHHPQAAPANNAQAQCPRPPRHSLPPCFISRPSQPLPTSSFLPANGC